MKWLNYDNIKMEDNLRRELKEKLNVPEYILNSFINRGITTFEKAMEIYREDEVPLFPPGLFEDMDKATARIETAVKNKEKITIYGDYDVDGVTAIVVLYLFFFKYLNYKNLDYYIPHRQDEGYGLNINALEAIKEKGAKLIITVDCGINAKKEVDFCRDAGIDIIITDHHMPDATLDNAYAVINPKLSESYPDKDLSGVGVAYKLICALAEKYKLEIKNEFLDFVALGTVSDIVPLTKENRILVRRGLKKIQNTSNTGLAALKAVAGLKEKSVINTYHLGFILGPRINAAGRMEHANKAVELFISNDPEKAGKIASELNAANEERKKLMNKTELEAIEKLNGKFKPEDDFVIVLYDKDWHAGIVGLVASKIVAKYNRPAFILTKDEQNMVRGSARSVHSVNIYESLKKAQGVIESFGGHKLAAGVTLLEDNVGHFRQIINEHLKNTKTIEQFEPVLFIDAEIGNEAITVKDIKMLGKLEPWGEGNPKPLFLIKNAEVEDVKYFKSNTLKFYCKAGARFYNFILFGHSETDKEIIKQGHVLDIVFSPSINVWNDEESVVLEVEDYK